MKAKTTKLHDPPARQCGRHKIVNCNCGRNRKDWRAHDHFMIQLLEKMKQHNVKLKTSSIADWYYMEVGELRDTSTIRRDMRRLVKQKIVERVSPRGVFLIKSSAEGFFCFYPIIDFLAAIVELVEKYNMVTTWRDTRMQTKQ